MDPPHGDEQQQQGDPAAMMQALWQRIVGLEAALSQLGQGQAVAAAAPAPTADKPSRPPKPDTFSGDRADAKSIRAWVYQVNNYFTAAREPEANRLPYAVALLRDNALLWWQSLKPAERPTTWDDLGKALVAYFAPLSTTYVARDMLARLIQKGSVKAYTDEFKKLVLNIPDMSESEMSDRYRRGLKPQVRLHVTFANPDTFEEMCVLAEQIDSIIYMNKPYGGLGSKHSPKDHGGSNPTPMEVGGVNEKKSYADAAKGAPKFPKLTAEERERLRASGGCFYCRKTGHIATECPDKKKSHKKR